MKKFFGLLALVFGLAIVPEAGAQSNTVRNMTENTSPATTYFLYCVHPSATPGDYKCTIANVLDTAIGSEVKFEAILGSDIVLEGEASVVTPAMLTTIDSPADNECYSYDSATATGEWVSCGGGGGGIVDVEEEDVTVTSSGSVIDFGAGFDITDSPSGEANIVLDLTEDQVDLSTETTGLLPFASLAGTEAQLEGVVSDISNILTDSENAATATALAANGANCSSGNYPLGVDASGAVESCAADDDVPEAGDFAAATDLDANGAIVTDAIGTAELDDDANTPVAAYFVVVETGAVSFDYLAELDSTHIADDAILAGDMGADDFGDWTCSAGNETCVLDSGVVDSVAIENRGIKGGDIALVVVDTEHLVAGAVDSTKIENRGIKGGDIALVVVDTEHLVAGAVDSTKIENRGIKGGDIALDIIAAEHMADEDHGDVSWTSGVSDVDESIFQDGGSDEIAVTAGMMNTGTSAAATTVWAGDNTWTQIDSTHILNGGILTGDMGNSDFGDFACNGNNAGCDVESITNATEVATKAALSTQLGENLVAKGVTWVSGHAVIASNTDSVITAGAAALLTTGGTVTGNLIVSGAQSYGVPQVGSDCNGGDDVLVLDLDNGNNWTITLEDFATAAVDCEIDVTNEVAGGVYTFKFTQNGTGTRSVTRGDGTAFPDSIIVSQAAGSITYLTCESDGSGFSRCWNDSYTRKSMHWGAGAINTDGTNCAAASVSANTLIPAYTIVCADNDGSDLYGNTIMPDGWDAGTVTFELTINQVAASTDVVDIDFAARCYSSDEVTTAWGATPTGEQSAAITMTVDNDILQATTAAITVDGTTCAAGDALYWTGQVDATASGAGIATAAEILSVKMEYGTISGD